MPRKFLIAKEIEVTVNDFGTSSRLSDPPSTGAKQLTMIDEPMLRPGLWVRAAVSQADARTLTFS